MYAVLMVDLKGSRLYEPERRNALQQYLVELTEALNRIFAPAMARELEFNGGDEIQGLFSEPSGALLCLRLLQRAVFPVPIHGGIGVGEWTVRTPERDTFYQDGPVYHRAREAIELAKKERDYMALLCTGGDGDRVLNAMLNAACRLTEQNSSHQNDLALLLELCFPVTLPDGTMNLRNLFDLALLLPRRQEICEGSGKPGKLSPEAFLAAADFGSQSLLARRTEEKTRNRYSGAHPYGAASTVVLFTGLKRQAVDTALRASNAYAERALALALRDELSEAWKEPDRD